MTSEFLINPITLSVLTVVCGCVLAMLEWVRPSRLVLTYLSLAVICLYISLIKPFWLIPGFVFLWGILLSSMIAFILMFVDWLHKKHPIEIIIE